VHIDFIFDTLCPWSFIAERHLGAVLHKYPHIPFDITLNPVPLSSTLLFSEKPAIQSVVLINRIRQVREKLAPVAETAGIEIDFDALPAVTDVSLSYLFIRSAEKIRCAWEAMDAVFRSFFCEGRDIGDPEVLCDISESVGTTRKTPDNIAVNVFLPSKDVEPPFLPDGSFFSTPTLVFDKKLMMTGAVPPKIVEKMVETAFSLENEELNDQNNQ